MKYAVYILAGNDKGKRKDLVKDKTEGALLKAAAVGALEDLVGVDFYDPVASSLGDEKSVAISGKTITSMDYKTAVSFSTRYKISDDKNTLEDVYKKTLKHTLTVKGVLDANNEMLLIPGIKELFKKKDLSRVWKWANTHYDADKKEYCRDVVAISYSTAQERYRALVMIDASVGSYEEYFDKDGTGHFTLVINKVIGSSTEEVPNEGAVILEGPTFDFSLTQLASGYGKAVSIGKKGLDKGIEVAEKFGYEPNEAKKFSKLADRGFDTASDLYGKGKFDITPTNIANQIERHVDTHKIIHNEAIENDTTETKIETSKEQIEKDGKMITVTVIKKTTKNPDGSKTIVITKKDAKDNVISTETQKVKA